MTLQQLQERSDMSVFICLLNESEKLGWLFKSRFRQGTKQKVERFIRQGKILSNIFEKMMGGTDDLHEVSEAFATVINIACRQNETKFLELMGLIKAWDAGEITVIQDKMQQRERIPEYGC